MEKTYNRDEVAMIARDAANISAEATIYPARWCNREEGEGVGDWTSRARSIAIHEFIRMRLLADGFQEEAKKPKISAEEWFRSFCFGLTNRHEPSRGNNVILYDKEIDGKVVTLFEQDWVNGYLWVSRAHIWSVLLTRYNMNHQQVREFVQAQVEEVMKWKGLTAANDDRSSIYGVEEVLTWKGLTTGGEPPRRQAKMEEVLKWKGLTTLMAGNNRQVRD